MFQKRYQVLVPPSPCHFFSLPVLGPKKGQLGSKQGEGVFFGWCGWEYMVKITLKCIFVKKKKIRVL